MCSPGVVPLDPSNKKHVAAAARLHAELLPESMVPGLGRLFMERFYYTRLVADGLVQCDLYRRNAEFVGFSAYTRYPFTFMDEGKKRYFLRLSLIVAASLISKPPRIRILCNILKQSSERKGVQQTEGAGEYLSLGIRADSADLIDAASGLRVTDALYARAVDYLRKQGLNRMRLVIKKENKLAIRFHKRHGGVIQNDENAPKDACVLIRNLQQIYQHGEPDE